MAEGAPPIDAEVRDLAGYAHFDSTETRAELDRVDLVTRGMPLGVPRATSTACFAPTRSPIGTASRNEKRAAASRVKPSASAALIVTPEREGVLIGAAQAPQAAQAYTVFALAICGYRR